MAEFTQKHFLSGKRRVWFMVILGFTLAAALALPDVDQALRHYRELGELRAKLESRAGLPERARALKSRVDELKVGTASLEVALVPVEALATLHQDLTHMARNVGCRLRSVRPGPSTRRPLNEPRGRPGRPSRRSAAVDWEVEEQISSASIRGSYANLLEFLAVLEKDERILMVDSLDLSPPPDSKDELLLDIRIKSFDLHRGDPG